MGAFGGAGKSTRGASERDEWLTNYLKTVKVGYHRRRHPRKGGADGRTRSPREEAPYAHHLARARRALGDNRARARRARPAQEHRVPTRGSASRPGRHHLPAQDGLPVEPFAKGVPRRLDRASQLPAVGGSRGARPDLGGTCRGVRRSRRRRLGVAGGRRGDGQGPFFGGTSSAPTPPTGPRTV